jgi:hypothetical protein
MLLNMLLLIIGSVLLIGLLIFSPVMIRPIPILVRIDLKSPRVKDPEHWR